MKTATVADLRNNFRRVSAWIEHGETVQILKRGQPFAQLTAAVAAPDGKRVRVDIMAQLKEVWGDKVFTTAEIEAMREAEREGDWG